MDGIKVELILGSSKLKPWYKIEPVPGGVKFIGMSTRIDYDQNGRVVGVNIEPTGCDLTMYTDAND
jgi:hypothetical protein